MTIKPYVAAIAAASSLVLFFGQTAHASDTYVKGQCTWYAKKRRPDLPNRLGNANTWYVRAAAKGFPVGTKPRAGAVGATTQGALGHVAYVESVHKNGTVTISEMNYNGGVGIVHKRTVVASSFKYIYKKRTNKPRVTPNNNRIVRPEVPFAYGKPHLTNMGSL